MKKRLILLFLILFLALLTSCVNLHKEKKLMSEIKIEKSYTREKIQNEGKIEFIVKSEEFSLGGVIFQIYKGENLSFVGSTITNDEGKAYIKLPIGKYYYRLTDINRKYDGVYLYTEVIVKEDDVSSIVINLK